MNKRDFLTSTVENISTVADYVIANGFTVNGKPWTPKQVAPATLQAKVSQMTDEEIDSLYLAVGLEFSESSAEQVVVKKQVQTVPAELLADEIRETITNSKGEEIPVIMVPFVERTKDRKKRNFKFAMKNGMEVIVNPYDNVLALGLEEGDMFPINPDTVVFTQQEGYLYAKPNFSHSIFTGINTAREELSEKQEIWEAKLRIEGVSQKDINAQRLEQSLKDNPMPKLQGFKFKA